MKLQLDIDGKQSEIDFKRDGNNVFANIAGREYELEVSSPEQNIYLLKHGSRIFEVSVSPGISPADPLTVRTRDWETEVRVFDPRSLRGVPSDSGTAQGAAELKTLMPGKVVRVIVNAGDKILAGQGVIVVEAMKMQNELRSPKDGTVKEVRFSEGDTVNAGEVLIVIE